MGDDQGPEVSLVEQEQGADDDADTVAENRRRIVEAVLPGAALATVYQVHSARCVRYLSAPRDNDRPEADAMVTERPGLLLGIVTADCAPVLLADAEAGVVGAAHAGWKGAIGGVCEETVAAMERLGARSGRIAAAIGPCIAQKSYEVDAAFLERFLSQDQSSERFFREGRDADHFQFDLEAYVGSRLAAAGVGKIEMPGLDTYSDEAHFFSFRRATHLGEPTYGRQMSVIGLKNQR